MDAPGLSGYGLPPLLPGGGCSGYLTQQEDGEIAKGTEVVWCVEQVGSVIVPSHVHILLAMEYSIPLEKCT